MKILIGNDHAGTELKFEIMKHLEDEGYEVKNFGTDTTDRVDYPKVGEKVAEALVAGEGDLAVLNCETDFVGSNADFVGAAKNFLNIAVENRIKDIEALKAFTIEGRTISELVTDRPGTLCLH